MSGKDEKPASIYFPCNCQKFQWWRICEKDGSLAGFLNNEAYHPNMDENMQEGYGRVNSRTRPYIEEVEEYIKLIGFFKCGHCNFTMNKNDSRWDSLIRYIKENWKRRWDLYRY